MHFSAFNRGRKDGRDIAAAGRDLWQMGSIDAQYYRPEYVVLRSFYAIEIESAAIEGGLNVRLER